MISLYADLVELGLRVLQEETEGKIPVPLFLRINVAEEINRRKSI